MNIIKTSYFKSDLKKGQIQALAIDHSKELYEHENCIDSHVMLKKAKLYIDTLLMENEKNALLIWEANAAEYRNITYNQGGKTLDYIKDPIYASIKLMLDDRKELLDLAFKSKDSIFDGEGTEVPKVPIKSFRKQSLNVKL